MALTAAEIKTKITTLFADNTIGAISEADLREVTGDIVDLAGAPQVTSTIPLWASGLTFQTDGTGDGEFCRYADSSGAVRLWQTKTDNNTGNTPPSDPGTTENANWKEVSPSNSSPIVEWAAGLYGDGLIIVYYNDALYKLEAATRPYNSTDIVAEITAGDWTNISAGGLDPATVQLLANIISVAVAAGTYTLDQASKSQRIFKTTTAIATDSDVDIQNGAEGSVFSWYLKVTGVVNLDFTGSTDDAYSDSRDWAAGVLTLDGDTASRFEIAGLYIDGGWNVKVSGKVV